MLCLPPEDWILGSMCCDGHPHRDLIHPEGPISSGLGKCSEMGCMDGLYRSTWTARGVESSVDAPT